MYYSIMPKYIIQRSPVVKLAVDKINAYLLENNITASSIARSINISQPQVSKVLSGKTKKPNITLIELCDYAKIKLYPDSPEPHLDPRIAKAVAKVWDGQDRTIELIARMIECVAHVNDIPKCRVNE